MHVLLTGATGFIGRHVCARLLARGHTVTAAVRAPASALRRFSGISAVRVDMNRMSLPAEWMPFLVGVDAVVNCAGVLQTGRGQSAASIHDAAPVALFEACLATGIRRVVQVSAVSADDAAGTEYALTKKAADDHLRTLDLDWTVLRPSLVYGQGSFGGTSAIRGLAGLPWITPLIGGGDQTFQPIHADDLAETIVRCLETTAPTRRSLDPVGPDTLTLGEIIAMTRRWLDLPPAREVRIPMPLMRLLARIGDAVGAGPVTTTSLRQMEYGNTSDAAAFEAAIGFRPRTMARAFRDAPSHVQDRWHARLYFLRPALGASLALMWLGSGIAGLANTPHDAQAIVMAMGVPLMLAPVAVTAMCLLDIAIGVLLVAGRGGARLGLGQLAIVAGYTAGLGGLAPALWADPYGALLKNLPIMGAILTWTALQNDK